jgi:class 3 adenylate cyclase/pimeloyl-ACP methyl ester carboxylesterase
MSEREIRYCTTEDRVSIAYATSGDGEITLVHTPNSFISLLQMEQLPSRRDWTRLLNARFRFVRYDQRGTGMSQRDVADLAPNTWTRDLRAVVDSLGGTPVAIFGNLRGTLVALRFAVEFPDAVSHLLLWPPPPVPEFDSAEGRALGGLAVANWEAFTENFAHYAVGWDEGDEAHGLARSIRESITPDTWFRYMRIMAAWSEENPDPGTFGIDASQIRIPTLIMQRPIAAKTAGFVRLAAGIPGARVEVFEGDGGMPTIGDRQAVVEAMVDFVGARAVSLPPHENEQSDYSGAPARAEVAQASGTAVILFTDIVSSTELTERMGDARFRDASRSLDAGLRAAIRDADGAAIDGKLLGDGVLATFPSAAQAIDGARRCLALSTASELGLHIGLHAGDVIREENNVFGGAVNIAARICGLSAPGEILVSDVVRGMARSSAGVVFEDRGEQEMKGVGEPVRVYAVVGEGD